jgi:hypothetical protein
MLILSKTFYGIVCFFNAMFIKFTGIIENTQKYTQRYKYGWPIYSKKHYFEWHHRMFLTPTPTGLHWLCAKRVIGACWLHAPGVNRQHHYCIARKGFSRFSLESELVKMSSASREVCKMICMLFALLFAWQRPMFDLDPANIELNHVLPPSA